MGLEIRKWKRHFCWWPIRTQQGDLRWLRFVMKKNIDREGGVFYIYTDIKNG